MKKLFNSLLFVGILTSFQTVQSQSYYSCDRWANTTSGTYTIYNNIWGEDYGTQCLSVNSYSDWWVDANHTGSGIKSYPNVEQQVDIDVDDMGTLTSYFSVSHPGSGDYTCAYDIWYDDYAYEIMLWMNTYGDIGPISYTYGCSGYPSWACPVKTSITVGGHTWDIYQGTNGSNIVYSFVRTSNTNSGTVDIAAISQWLRDNDWFDNVNLHSIQFGFEITATDDDAEFAVNGFNVTQGSSDDDDDDDDSGSSVTNSTISGTYSILAYHSGMALDCYAWGTSNGTNICQWSYWGGNCQKFIITPVDDEWHRITPYIATDQAIDVYGISSDNGANINTWEYWGGYGQQFRFQVAGSNRWRIINRNSEKCLDVSGASTEDGANVLQWTCTSGSTWQMFTLTQHSSRKEALTGMEDLTANAINAYPNPAKDVLNINLNGSLTSANLIIYDMAGKQVLTTSLNDTENQVHIESLASGLYIIKLINGENIYSSKFSKR